MALDRDYAGLLGFPTRIPEKLKAIREHLGLTPDQLAQRVDAKNGAEILAYENDELNLSITILWGYAKAAGIPVEQIINDDRDVHQAQRRF
jgi:transcriptional regulator with XRE-family HTH domain